MKHSTNRLTRRGGALAASLILALGIACAAPIGAASSSSAPIGSEPESDEVAVLQALYESAKEEGSLMVYSALAEAQVQQQIVRFNEAYPDLDVEYVRLSVEPLQQRFSAEADAGVNAADVLVTPDLFYLGDGAANGLITPLGDADLPGGFPPPGYPEQFAIGDGVSAAITIAPRGIAYNTDLVDPEDVPTSFADLVDPQWQDMIASYDPGTYGPTAYAFFHFLDETFGGDYLTGLRDLGTNFALESIPGAQAVAAGEYAFQIPGIASVVAGLQAEGAPIDIVIPDATTGTESFIGLPSNAPHPNAARLFVHFALSEQGANLMAADSVADVSPWGGGGHSLPSGYESPAFEDATTEERMAEIDALLGL